MAGSQVLNTASVRLQMQRMAPAAQQEFDGELDVLSALLGRRMTRLAPKWRSRLGVSVTIRTPQPLTRDIGPTASYAAAQEMGVRPGGKGLPRMEDPQAADIVAWLRDRVRSGAGAPRRGSIAAVRQELQLRDRFHALMTFIRRRGLKPHPFVKPAFEQMEPTIQVRLQAAGERAMQRGAQA